MGREAGAISLSHLREKVATNNALFSLILRYHLRNFFRPFSAIEFAPCPIPRWH